MRRAAAALLAIVASAAVPAPLAGDEALSCLAPVNGVSWSRAEEHRDVLDRWCRGVGPPVLEARPPGPGRVARLLIVSWNVHVGGGRLADLFSALKTSAAPDTGFVLLLQEAYRAGDAVPETYPSRQDVPDAIRPRGRTSDIVRTAEALGLSVAYVPSMRNGPGRSPAEREDRGNAILSTEPLTDVRALELPFGHERRVAVAATVTPRGQRLPPMRVVALHLDTGHSRREQAEALGKELQRLIDLPLVAGGDLNARHGVKDDAVRTLVRYLPLEPCGTGRTYRLPLHLDFVVGRLDYIFSTLPPTVTHTCRTATDRYHSDHVPLVMTVG